MGTDQQDTSEASDLMPLAPDQWISMQPAIRCGDEYFFATAQVAWTPDTTSKMEVTTSLKVTQGEERDLRSLVVAAPVGYAMLPIQLRTLGQDLLDLVRRSANPYDDLL